MIRKRVSPELVFSIIDAIIDAENRFFRDPESQLFVVPDDDADAIVAFMATLVGTHPRLSQ